MGNKIFSLQKILLDKELSLNEYEIHNKIFIETYYKYRKKEDSRLFNRLSLNQRRKIHKILLWIYTLKNRLDGVTVEVIKDEHIHTHKPKIFVPTHVGRFDIGAVSEAIKEHYYLLSGDFEHIQGTVEADFLALNGVFYFNEKNKEDRRDVVKRMERHLRDHGNLMWFIEGTWNLSPNLPVLPCYWGIVDIAREANADIVPIAVEQYGMHFKIAIGKNFDMRGYEKDIEGKTNAITDLRDCLAGLKWDIWETEPVRCRKNIMDDEWKKYTNKRLEEWNFRKVWIDDMVFKPKQIVSAEEVFAPIKALRMQQ